MIKLEEPTREGLNKLLVELMRAPKSKDTLDAIAKVRAQIKALG